MGRPQADIDWNSVDELLMSGCSGAEISANIGINPATLYDRCQTDHGKMFSAYSQEKNAKGESLLRDLQFKKALGLTDKGDNTLLIWLGKTRLKQVDAATQVNSGNTFTIKVDPNGLGTGVNISAQEVPASDNQSPKSGD